LIFTLALFVFVVIPASSWLIALKTGVLLGFIIYSVYSLSNASFIKDWNWRIVVFDVLWGAVLGGVTSVIAYYILKAML
jgi:uncharacterized membrane protein